MRKKWLALVVAVAAIAALVAGCGGSDDTTSSNVTSGTESGGDSAKNAEQAQTELEALYKGTFTEPPSESPPPAPNKSVYLIGTDMALSATSNAINGAKDASEALGWSTTVVNGKSDPSQMLNGVREAVAANADAIFLYAIDCPTVQAGLEAAEDAGMLVVAAESYDCSELEQGAPDLYDYVTTYAEGPLEKWGEAWGGSQATVLAAKTDGEAKVLNLVEPDFRATIIQDRGFKKQLEKCATCEIVDTVEFVAADIGPELQQRIEQALLQNPDVNATLVPYDAITTIALAPALRAAGKTGQVIVAGGEGTPEGVNLLRQGLVSSETGIPTAWEGWGAIDNLNRLFNDEKTAPTGLGIQVIDEEHNMPNEGGFTSPVDFEAAYKAAWGVSG